MLQISFSLIHTFLIFCVNNEFQRRPTFLTNEKKSKSKSIGRKKPIYFTGWTFHFYLTQVFQKFVWAKIACGPTLPTSNLVGYIHKRLAKNPGERVKI